MHQPAAFVETNPHTLRKLVSDYPLATLIIESPNGVLINHIPLLWNDKELHGHVARPNELVEVLQRTENQPLKATAVFHGPEGYISPADYPSKLATGKVVPTWNYAVVHIHGTLQLRDDPIWVRQQVDALTEQQERHAVRATQQAADEHLWSLDDAPSTFADAVTRSIVGVAFAIHQAQGKFKLSQNRPEADQLGASAGARKRGQDRLAELMDKTNGE